MANSSQHLFASILEAVYGTTPATPAALKKRITGTTLGLQKGEIESNAIDPNRQVVDVRHGNRQIGGDISVELCGQDFDDWLEAVFCGTWTGDELVPGVVRRSYTHMRHFTDQLAAADPVRLYKGCEFNTFKMDVNPEAFVEATFGVVGRELFIPTDGLIPAGTVYTEPLGKRAFDSFSGNATIDGVAVANITSLSLSLENGIVPRFVVFADVMNRPRMGKTRVSGELTLNFEDASLLTAFNGGQIKSLVFTLISPDSIEYTFTVPHIFGSGLSEDASGEEDIVHTFPFKAIYDPNDVTTPDAISIQRVTP